MAEHSEKRAFVFAEFFAGMGGFSTTMAAIGGEHIKVIAPLDGYDGWDILSENGFNSALEICEAADHGHFAPPCRTLSRARRSDAYGTVAPLRSDTCPEGWGSPDSEEANKIVAKMVALIPRLLDRGCTFAVENPWSSYLWLLKVMQRIMKRKDVELVLLNQCAYGAPTPKATGLLTNSEWMKMVNLQCHQVAWHHHLKGGLVGKAWSYLEDKLVWRTSLAAEYPCGLTVAWCRSLLDWLRSENGMAWLSNRSYSKLGRWGNVLVLGGRSQDKLNDKDIETAAERRERENWEALGGLRHARRAVLRSSRLRHTGQKLRRIIDEWMTPDLLQKLENDIAGGLADEAVLDLRSRLTSFFNVDSNKSGLQSNLWRAILQDAGDPEQNILPEWMETGFPLGIEADISQSGVFPVTDCDTAAVEASRTEGRMMQDEDGEHSNYVSFVEAKEKAQQQLDKLLDQGRAECFTSWAAVEKRFGGDACLTKLACIIKQKPDGGEKVRLVVDCRRSGVNGKMHIRERVTLPRITDVASGLQKLLEANSGWNPSARPQLMSADFSDAFHMLKLRDDERKYLVVKGMEDSQGRPRYYVMRVVVFGVAPGPLLWGRLAAAAMRISQAVVKNFEGEVNTFVDDPLVISMACSQREHTATFVRYLATWRVLGLEVAWHKADRGTTLTWIGFQLTLCGKAESDLRVELTAQKQAKLEEVFEKILACKGVVPVHILQYAVGVLGWMTSAISISRPWLAMLWAAITQRQHPTRSTTRVRKGLVFVKQVENAVRWLHALIRTEAGGVRLQKVFRWRPHAPTVLVQTDACPQGIGGFLCIGGSFIAYFNDKLSHFDFERFGSTPGDPAFQSEYELLALVVAVRVFQPWILHDDAVARVVLRSDNMATVGAAMRYKAVSPIMAQLTVELMLELESMQVSHVLAQHVAGSLNHLADELSRMVDGQPVPSVLQGCEQVTAPVRDDAFYTEHGPGKIYADDLEA